MKNKVYNVWISNATSPTQSWTVCPRLMVNQFRVAERGLGKGSLTLFSGNSSVEKTGYVDNIVPGLWVKITRNGNDEGDELSQGPGNVQFIGYVDTVEENISVNNPTGQNKGYVTINEMGWKFAETVMNSARDNTNVEMREGDVFNPFYRGKIFYNKEAGQVILTRVTDKFDLLSTEYEGDTFPYKDFAWTRMNVINHISQRSPYSIEFSLDKAPGSSNDDWKDLNSFVKRSYENMDEMTLGQALDLLLPDPYSWHFNYQSSLSSLSIVICSKNVAPIADIPAGQTIEPTITRMKEMTVVSHESPVDQLIYRGARILFTGSFTTLNTGSSDAGLINKTMDRDWTGEQRDQYQSAIYNSGVNQEPFQFQANEQFRQSNVDMVYQKYKFIQPARVPQLEGAGRWSSTMYVTEMAGERDTVSKPRHFFPILDLSNEEGVISTESIGISSTRTQHAQPGQFQMVMEPHLGIYNDSTDAWRQPIVAYYSAFDADNKFWYNLINAPKVGLMEAKLEQTENGIQLRMPYPEFLGKDDINIFTDGAGNITVPPLEGWTLNHVSRYNPAEAEVVNNGNWQRMIFTLAYRSDQRLEWTENRRKLIGITINPDGETTTRHYQNLPVIRSLVISDEDLQLYFNHTGTVYDIDLAGFIVDKTAALKRLEENTITRNDFPELIKKCKQQFANLALDRRAMTLSLPLDENPDWLLLGKIPVSFKYFDELRQINYLIPVNTPITSIEWTVEGGETIIKITTDIPDMPLYAKVLDAARTES